jgi:hypothetical protein
MPPKRLDIQPVPLPHTQGRKPGEFSPRTAKSLHPMLPGPPFFMLMVAPSGVGKTTLLMNMLCRPEYYGGKFEQDHVIIWSGTKTLDPIWSSPWVQRTFAEDNIFDSFSQEHLEQVVNQVKEERDSKDMRPYLLVFDDMITEGICSNVPWMVGMLEKLSMWGRHVGISTILLSQKYNMISKKIRLRDTIDWIIFKVSQEELRDICEEQCGRLDKADFRKLYEYATAEPFSFMHISGKTQDPQQKYRKRFDSILSWSRPQSQ